MKKAKEGIVRFIIIILTSSSSSSSSMIMMVVMMVMMKMIPFLFVGPITGFSARFPFKHHDNIVTLTSRGRKKGVFSFADLHVGMHKMIKRGTQL